MTRKQIKQHNQRVIALVAKWLNERRMRRQFGYRLPLIRMGYKELAAKLNVYCINTSRGNRWTFRSLYRMMQRQGVCLHILDRY